MCNSYCEALGINVPVFEDVKDHREANVYTLLIVALLERGEPMTLAEVSDRFAEAGVAPAESALRSLKRCRPARNPVYRDGDHYALDPYDEKLDLWVFRLGLRPPKVSRTAAARPQDAPLLGPDVPLTIDELDRVWRDESLYSWSAQRVALAVLDAHGEPMAPAKVVAFVDARARGHMLSTKSAEYWRKGAAIRVRDDGRWEIVPEHGALQSARVAVRDRLERIRRWEAYKPDPEAIEANRLAWERKRAAHAMELALLHRVLVYGFPAGAPKAVVLVDVGAHEIATFLGPELDIARERLADYEVIGAVEVRALLRALDFDPGERRLAELGTPQKSKRLNRRGRTLKITTTMMVQGSCGISRPFGEEKKLQQYLSQGQTTRLHRRLEADAKSLFALYEYGRLHGAVRLRWGFLDEMISAPWVHRDELGLYGMMRQAYERNVAIEAVIGSAPGWAEPWARAQVCWVEKDLRGSGLQLVDEDGYVLDNRDVQLARLVESVD